VSVSTNDLKNGMTLDLDGTLFQVIEFQHVKPGKGGAFVRTKIRNVKTGAVIERTFNAGVKIGMAIVERTAMQFLYTDAGQGIPARHNLRPRSDKVLAKCAKQFPKLNTFTVDEVFGGWTQAQKDHFNDGATYDQVIAAAKSR